MNTIIKVFELWKPKHGLVVRHVLVCHVLVVIMTCFALAHVILSTV